ncbi:hypothetical protein [Microbacterium sp. KSW4-4]|uniref:hypothetical protein n=1 Tax=Microbacterium sp. KSW4-4 TaxID=2851651 RepID=UPI001FFCE46C|nr:hypothetical protein [Microbacterium sp. KSW4-4]MCK2032198.1 hypothetical protein [Microbacterium sp. KSW4-4]
MEIAGFVVAVLAVVAAGASVLYARGANSRADEANRTAEKALDLQARADAREREFREVRWEAGYDLDDRERPVFRLTNVGHTDAHSVSLLLATPGRRETLFTLGNVGAGGSAQVVLTDDETQRSIVELMILTADPWRVHWSSPLGHAEEYQYPGSPVR